MECVISVDIGGTGIKYGVIDQQGNILFNSQRKSDAQKGANFIMSQVKQIIKEMLERDHTLNIIGIGVSSAGQIDHINGKVIYATDTIPGYTGVNIKKILEDEFKLPAFVENDVNAAAIGEAWIGAGNGYQSIICLTIGTGVGGCIMIDGQVEHGSRGSAGEIGHMIIEHHGRPCNCGNHGCLEQYASATALIENYQQKVKNDGTPPIPDEEVNALYIFEAAKAGDSIANAVINEFIQYLGTGIISLVHLLNPQLIVIGGGISNQGSFLTNKLQDYIQPLMMPSFQHGLRIETAKFGNLAGILGAAKIAFNNLI